MYIATNHLPTLILPPPAGTLSAAPPGGDSAEGLPPVNGLPSAVPAAAGDAFTALLNSWFPAEVLPLKVEPEMFGRELLRNRTGPCCAVLLLKVQETILASWQLFCRQTAPLNEKTGIGAVCAPK